MTLNLTLLTQHTIYQSADYRLSVHGKPLEQPSTKRVFVQYTNWSGFITYTGVGMVGTKPTSEVIEEWLDGKDGLSLAELGEVVRASASAWFARLRSTENHTFVLAGFVDGKPTALVVSNFQKLHGASFPLAREFVTSTVVGTGKPELIITGVATAVSRADARYLKRQATIHGNDTARVRRELSTINRRSAARCPALISEDCIVYSLDRYGRSHEEPFGTSRTTFSTLTNGNNLRSALGKFFEGQFGPAGYTLAGATSATSESVKAPMTKCEPSIAQSHTSPEYSLVALRVPAGQRATPRGIDRRGMVVGEGSDIWNGGASACMWSSPTSVEFLPAIGAIGGRALAINEQGTIAGNIQLSVGSMKACSWKRDDPIPVLLATDGLYSDAVSINHVGQIVGYTCVHPSESGQLHHRPTSWPVDGPPSVLRELEEGWGEAVDVNDRGQIVVRVHSAVVFALMWHGDGVERLGSPDPSVHFYPHQIEDDGAVIGLFIERTGTRGAAIRKPDGSWKSLFQPKAKREFQAARGAEFIAGREQVDGYLVPWVKRTGRDIVYLPHFSHHNHNVTGISAEGWIIGTASADQCTHPIVWVPT